MSRNFAQFCEAENCARRKKRGRKKFSKKGGAAIDGGLSENGQLFLPDWTPKRKGKCGFPAVLFLGLFSRSLFLETKLDWCLLYAGGAARNLVINLQIIFAKLGRILLTKEACEKSTRIKRQI